MTYLRAPLTAKRLWIPKPTGVMPSVADCGTPRKLAVIWADVVELTDVVLMAKDAEVAPDATTTDPGTIALKLLLLQTDDLAARPCRKIEGNRFPSPGCHQQTVAGLIERLI